MMLVGLLRVYDLKFTFFIGCIINSEYNYKYWSEMISIIDMRLDLRWLYHALKLCIEV